MQAHRIPYRDTHRFGRIVLDLLADAEEIGEFRAYPHTLEGLTASANARSFDPAQRQVLCEVLRRQHADPDPHPAVRSNLEALADPRALTVATGHQLCLFGGPLYVAFKIINTVRLARDLSAALDRPVVPVFWMASEDHDRAEIDHVTIGGRHVQWPGEAGGAVGVMKLTGVAAVVEEAIAALGSSSHAGPIVEMLRAAYRPERTLAQATRHFLHAVFGRFGVVIVDGDDPALKQLFAPLMREELLNQVAFRAVTYANDKLGERYGAQAHVREINLFHLRPGHRSRIELRDDRYQVLDGGPALTLDELLAALENDPQVFSPNVLMRPIYQEHILPNVATIGGGGELAYWLQLRWLFQALRVPMPAVLLRSSAAFVAAKQLRQWHDMELTIGDLFRPEAEVHRQVVERGASDVIGVEQERATLRAMYDGLAARATTVDPTLRGLVEGRAAEAVKGLDRIAEGMLRAVKRRESTTIERITRTHAQLFPGGEPQERVESFIKLIADQGDEVLDLLLDRLDPLDPRFTVFEVA
ncbi:MAG: bacillithiol biosynthesis cysteine-adding enzyme BshC [Flavobacteriales bacterium]|nr:bacillithiol biosynthesis cysteine-adding enzyme BshC [Flavobacteriales bacterium]